MSTRITLPICAAVFLGLLIAVLAADLAPLSMDTWWAALIDHLDSPTMTTAQTIVSDLGAGLIGGLLIPAAIAACLWRFSSAVTAGTFVLGLLVSVAAVQVIKHLVARPRPPGQMTATDFGSFPSGHVANAATLTVLLVLLLRRRWLIAVAVIWPAVMAVSRTYLNVHWLSDTLAGAALGTGLAVCTVAAATWARPRLATRGADRPKPGVEGPGTGRDPQPSEPAATIELPPHPVSGVLA